MSARINPCARPIRRGVTVLELMVAMIAASVVLAGSATIYMSALDSFFGAGTMAAIVASRSEVDDLMIRLANQCLPRDLVAMNDALGQPTILTYIRGTRLVPKPFVCRTVQRPHEGYPIIDDRQPGLELAAFGCPAANPLPPPSPFPVTGVIFWYRGSTVIGQSLASRLYHFEISGTDWVTAGLPAGLAVPAAGRTPYFTGISLADLNAFFGLTVTSDAPDRAVRRLACHVIGTQVSFFSVLAANGLNWLVEYDRAAAP